jgi:hypothetical protein
VAEKEPDAYLSRCGDFTSKLSKVKQWEEVMAATGAMHGGTLSYTRLIAMPGVVRWKNKVGVNWDIRDVSLMSAALGTTVGMEDERDRDSEGPYAEQLREVLKLYDSRVTKLKKKYQDKIVDDEDFNDFVWIFTDFCLDNFDGKQLTIATCI